MPSNAVRYGPIRSCSLARSSLSICRSLPASAWSSARSMRCARSIGRPVAGSGRSSPPSSSSMEGPSAAPSSSRSRSPKRSLPRAASSTRPVVTASWPARPRCTTFASGGVISAGGPAMRIDSESRKSGSRPERYQAQAAAPSVPSSAIGPTMSPSTAFNCRARSSRSRPSAVISFSRSASPASMAPPTSPTRRKGTMTLSKISCRRSALAYTASKPEPP